jgi:ABC-type lipoprotein export system ATPase subunit
LDIALKNIVVRKPGTNDILLDFRKLEISGGARLLIRGPSGIGKTTLLHLIAGLFLPDKGDVQIGGTVLNNLSDGERSTLRRNSIGIIFQKLNLIDHLTVAENTALPLYENKNRKNIVTDALKKINMEGFANEPSNVLSLGEQQRVAVARVLCMNPDIVLADEPTSSLDDINAGIVIDALINLPKETTLITVSHDHRIENKFLKVLNFSDIK